MFKSVFISVCVLLLPVGGHAQLSSLGGEISYIHQYSDNLANGRLTSFLGRTPAINLQASGVIVSNRLADFSLQTNLSRSSITSRSLSLRSDFAFSNYTLYNLNLTMFQFSPVRLRLRAHDGLTRTESSAGSETTGESEVRSRTQQAEVTIRQIALLPVLNFSYSRSNAEAVIGTPSHYSAETFTAATAVSNGNTNINISGQTNINEDIISGTRIRYSSVNLQGSKTISDSERVSLHSDYTWYSSLGNFQNALSYTSTLGRGMSVGTNVGFTHTSSPFFSSNVLQGTVNLIYSVDPGWRYNLNAGGSRTMQALSRENSISRDNRMRYQGGGSVTHTGAILSGMMSSTLSVAGSLEENSEEVGTYSVGLSNSYAREVGGTKIRLTQASNATHVDRSAERQWRVSNNIFLSGDSRLSGRFSNRASVRFTTRDITGTSYQKEFSTKSLSAGESIRGGFSTVIPLTAGAGFFTTWYFGEVNGKTYGWDFDLNSPRFFLDHLTARYHLSRRYNVAIRRSTIEQRLQFSYRWRLLDFKLLLFQRNVESRERNVVFNVSRSF